MKVKMTALIVLAVAFAISFSTVAPAAPGPNAKAVAAAMSQPAAAPAAVPQDHPEIREAIESLRRAKEHLLAAKHDYHGHREAAVHATDDAIRQLELCLKFD